jgi:hypothetical protein
MPVRTGAVDSHYLIRSMKTFYPLCDDHEHSQFFRRIILDGQVLVGEKEFLVQMNNGGSASSTPQMV